MPDNRVHYIEYSTTDSLEGSCMDKTVAERGRTRGLREVSSELGDESNKRVGLAAVAPQVAAAGAAPAAPAGAPVAAEPAAVASPGATVSAVPLVPAVPLVRWDAPLLGSVLHALLKAQQVPRAAVVER